MRPFTLVCLLVVLTPGAGAAQTGAPTLRVWREAIERHAPGQIDAAVSTVAGWSTSDLDRVLGQLVGATAPADRLPLLRRAILLHTDVLVLLRRPGGYDLPPDGDRSVGLVADALQMGVERQAVPWAFVRTLVDRLRETATDRAAVDQDARLWYRATAAFLETWEDWPESDVHLQRAKQLFPDDPVLLLYEGTIHEAYAGPRIQSLEPPTHLTAPEPVHFATGSVFGLVRIQRPTDVVWVFESAEIEATKAEEFFRRSLAIDPASAEARIRLGHVLAIRGRHAEAAAELRRGVDQATAPMLRYWGLLFLGAEERVLGNAQAAATAFRQAAAIYPDAQAPRLGMSQLALDRGDRAAALEAFQAGVASAPNRGAIDPRLAYDHAHAPGTDELLDELRRTFSR